MKQDMSITYGIKKQVTRLMARIWLKPRIAISLLLLFIVGSGSVWGQTDYSGVYYIANDNSASGSDDATKYDEATDAQKYYLVPAANPQQSDYRDAYYSPNHATTPGDPEKPFLTTYHTNKDLNSIWIVKKTGDYYYVIHALTGKYVIYEVPQPNHSNNQRKTMHLQTPDDGTYSLSTNNNYQFNITLGSSIYRLQPRNRSTWYWNPANGNKNKYYGQTADIYQSGLVGVYNNQNDGGSKWHFENTKLPAPTIVYDSDNDKFTISYDKIPAGFEILYTTDGSEPTIGGSTTQTYTNETVISLATIGDNPLKAVVVRYGLILSETALIRKPNNPTIAPVPGDCNNMVAISADEGTNIYYTLDGTDPTSSSTYYTEPLALNSAANIKAIAYSGNLHSGITTYNYSPNYSTKPTITTTIQNTVIVTLSGTGTIYYTIDGTEPTTSSTQYTNPFPLTGSSGDVITIKAVAKEGEKELSCIVEKTVTMGYYISNLSQLEDISSHPNDLCILSSDINASGLSESISGFAGIFDGGYYTISGLDKPLFTNLSGGTVKNVMFSDVGISGFDNAGAVCDEADGTTKIYNCGVLSGSVSGTNAGGLVGHIKSGSRVRVVNCYNYANVSGNDYAAGIVGYNEGTVGNVRIAMCMMYGTVSEATNISPVYAGNHESNAQNFTEYNYYLYSIEKDATGQKVIRIPYTDYNDQLAIDNEEYLTRYPFYRHILNNHRELASYFLFGDCDSNHIEELGHWVRKKGTNDPKYPIIEKWEVNRKSTPTKEKNDLPRTQLDYAGKLLTDMGDATDKGYLNVSINIDGNKYSAQLPITDMDTLRYDYNYGKVILPFANEYKINTDYSRICTGWKITEVTGGTEGSITNYNFADRGCTAKDIYNETTNPFIFAQGGYYIVPTGVTAISIEANFAKAYYLSDATYEIGYDSSYDNRTGLGGDVPTKFHGETVYNNLATAISNLATATTNPHKQAIVLVGNYHYDLAKDALATGNGFTLMSIDADNNQEPDYGFYSIGPDRPRTPALRFDFVPIISLGMAAKVNGSVYYPGVPIWKPRGWYEQTETTVSFMNQFELDSGNFTNNGDPCIINGGYFVQMIRSNNVNCNKVGYFKIGGNAHIKEFFPGSHSNKASQWATLVPVNVTGGQVDECYMTGYRSGAKAIGTDIRFWCSGGKIGKFLGAYMDEPWEKNEAKGNVDMTAQVDHALIGRFFGGGTSPSAAITGDISVTINNSKVDFYCGGPEFGDMSDDKVVKTNATNTTFGEYYGAGFGGTAITYSPKDGTPDIGASVTFTGYNYGSSRLKNSGSLGLATCYKFEYLVHSANKTKLVARFITGYANFNLATTGNVTNNLIGCTIEKDFYGAGCQGMVNGTVNSTLTDCTVKGNAFGGGYKAVSNEVKVYPAAEPTLSIYNGETSIFSEFGQTTPEIYTWQQGTGTTPSANEGQKILYCPNSVTMANLGNVTGAITLTINGSENKGSKIGTEGIEGTGNVFGGGNESRSLDNTTVVMGGNTRVLSSVYGGGNLADVNGSTSVNITGGTIGTTIGTTVLGGAEYGNVFGGGKGKADDVAAGIVKGSTTVSISGSPTILHNVYGGGAYGSVGTFSYDATTGFPTGWTTTDNKGKCIVSIIGGTIGSNGDNNGMVFGSSRGLEGNPETNANVDKMAWVYDTDVTIGTQGSKTGPSIKGSVYGGGENGHNFHDASVTIHSGTIGIPEGGTITDDGGTQEDESDDITYSGARYPYRGNVYGAGCGTDTYTGTDGKTYYVFNAGIVRGNTTVLIDGGHVVHNVYGGGAMGSVGTYTLDADGTNDIQDGMPISCAENTGLCTINISGGQIGMTNATMTGHGNDGPDDCGHVFGAGRGTSKYPVLNPNVETCAFFDNTKVTIEGTALVCGSVYGGSESGHVLHNTEVEIKGGQIGCGEEMDRAYTDDEFASSTSLAGTAHWEYTEAGMGATHDQYASTSGTYDYTNFQYIPEADRKATSEGGRPVATDGRTFFGNVFAGGSGYYPYAPGLWLKSAGHVGGTASVTVSGGHILNNLYGGCEMADIDGAVTVTMTGGTIGVPRTSTDIKNNPNCGNIYGAGMGDKRIFFNTSTNVASTTVNISNGTVYGAVYGGGEDGHVIGSAFTTIEGKTTMIGCDGKSGYDGNVFGAGQGHVGALTAGVVGGNASLVITGGTLKGSAYGGGRIASVGTYFAMADDSRYGKMQEGDDHGNLSVSLTGGTIHQNVYGGCMGTTEDINYGISKNVSVELNNGVDDAAQGCIVLGPIFGCNNVNSSPIGTSTVHIYKTQRNGASRITNYGEVKNAKVQGTKDSNGEYDLSSFDVPAVYGGGNLAAYTPKDDNGTTNVIIDGCGLTSIGQVYGGGNAASTPATLVTINGTYEIGELFGGGNGKDALPNGDPNPGANVGYKDYHLVEEQFPTKDERISGDAFAAYRYGIGLANVIVKGGTIHRVFGGSNTKGNVRETALTMLEEVTDGGLPVCDFRVDEAYGGGKSASMDAEAKLLMACIPGLKEVYGGAQAADIKDNVTLTITNGTFDRVFGGNNLSGTISGDITVNIEEVGCRPIIIGELYGGGNLAAYSVYGYNDDDTPKTSGKNPFRDPEVNVKSFTSIGTIYGGGYGEGALMVGSPTVNINEVADPDSEAQNKSYKENAVTKYFSDYAGETKTIAEHDVILPDHVKGKMGSIHSVFGGGNAAKVMGDTYVNIGTAVGEDIYMEIPVKVGATLPANCYTKSGDEYVPASGTASDGKTYYKKYEVLGVDIRDNVYGGGNNAEVTGDTHVTIGKKEVPTSTPTPTPTP